MSEKIIFKTFDMVNNDIFKIVQDIENPYLFKVYTTTFIQYSKMDTKEGMDYMIEKLMRMNFINDIESIRVNSISRTKVDTLVSWIFRIEFMDDSYKVYHSDNKKCYTKEQLIKLLDGLLKIDENLLSYSDDYKKGCIDTFHQIKNIILFDCRYKEY